MRVDYYRVLGIPYDADEATIRRTIREKLKELHPDRTHSLPADLRDYAEKRFRMVMEARRILLDPAERRRYDATLTSAFRAYVCEKCGEVNLIPNNPRRGTFVCRACGAELFTIHELPVDDESLATLVFSSLLTLRNMGIHRLRPPALQIARGEASVTVSFSGSGLYLGVEASSPSLVDTELRVLGIRKGRDRGAAHRLVQRLSVVEGPWLVRFVPLTSTWARWASTFVATSLFSLTPADARDVLEDHSWNLVEFLRRAPVRPDYVDRLKANWRAMAEPSIVSS